MAKEAEREKRPIRSYSDFADMVRDIAIHRDLNMEDVLDRFCGPVIQREYKRVIDEKHALVSKTGA